MKNVKNIIMVMVSSFLICAHARSSSDWQMFHNDQITFSYPSSIYWAPQIESPRSVNGLDKSTVVNIKKKRQNVVDSITICNDGIMDCASREEFDKPYWIEEASGRLVLFNPTEKLFSFVTRFGSGYEAFPICAWIDNRGVSSQYGGQCYVAVVSNGKKTISLNGVVGPNVGASRLKNAYKPQLDLYQRIIRSAE
ncbi:hypothetical protein [Burkholderia sp. Leaf177]|uniref:hypothetical protein n=1 Tax=Burkholderia sp. Leaf177 TaxID=1736287 RepID=UPI000A77672E|nr:hypothetical protein [Burkholderia sp. Leaf177]